jgi:hypothetical protein
MEIEHVVVDGDMTAVLVRTEGTNLGKINGVILPTAVDSPPGRATGSASKLGCWRSTGRPGTTS